ncbi:MULTISPECIES: restriction endonuclease subunit S [unclassified Streptomyces]|uniref:restriction endonuclease subunit S n=1 Tax=unclassified Streptomyces TaxID=2593676 RepID=UPI0036A53477
MGNDSVQLGEVLQLERIPIEVDQDTEYTQIGIRSFGRGIFHRDTVTGANLSKLRYFEVHPDRLIFSNIMAWEGAIALSGEAEQGCVGSSRFLSYRAVGDIDLRYLNYFFQSDRGRALVAGASTGSTVRNQTLPRDAIEEMWVPILHIDEQRRIADKLDASLGRVDSVRALRAKMTTLQASLAASLITSTIESATENVRVSDVIEFKRTPIKIDPDTEYRNIGIRSFGRGFIRHPLTAGRDLSKLNFFTFPENALALSNLMAWEGGISVTRSEDMGYIASNRFFFYLPIDNRVNISYLRHFLLSKQGQALIASACSAGAERNRTLGRKRFEELTFPLPPRPMQDRVTRTLDALAERLNAAYSEPALDALRPSILNEAFIGQL